MTSLRLGGLSSGYGGLTVVHSIDLAISSGDGVTVLMGANGAGKTTLCRTIAGILSSSSGSLSVDGTELNRASARRMVTEGVVMVPEGRQVFARMTVVENLLMGAYLRKHAVQDDLEQVFERFPILHERRAHKAGVLSGGEQQMLAIGRALMARPRVLILDEPTHGLAPAMVDEVISTVLTLSDSGVLVLLVEQNVRVAEAAASRVVLMANGWLVGDGVAAKMFAGETIMRAYLGESTMGLPMTARVSDISTVPGSG